MNPNNFATTAVKITNVIKENENRSSTDIMLLILNNVPELAIDANVTIAIFTTLADKLGIAYKDVYDIIDQLKYHVKTAITDVLRSNWLQTIANTLYYALRALNGMLPEPWHKISLIVLGVYEGLKGE